MFLWKKRFSILAKKWPKGNLQQGGMGVTKFRTEKKFLIHINLSIPHIFFLFVVNSSLSEFSVYLKMS